MKIIGRYFSADISADCPDEEHLQLRKHEKSEISYFCYLSSCFHFEIVIVGDHPIGFLDSQFITF